MRFALLLVAALAVLKVWTQDRLHRGALEDALLAAYRERARDVCNREMARRQKGTPSWSAADGIVRIGESSTDVAIWDTNNPLWDVRFKNPHIVFAGSGAGLNRCSFNLADGSAHVAN